MTTDSPQRPSDKLHDVRDSINDYLNARPPLRTLRRGKDDRIIAGVCSGLGRYFSLDPTLVRLAFVLLAVFGGTGLLLYVLCWALIPEADDPQ